MEHGNPPGAADREERIRPACAVWHRNADFATAAADLAAQLQLPLAAPGAPPAGYRLLVGPALMLQDDRPGSPGGIVAALAQAADQGERYRQAGAGREALLRAVGARRGHRPHVVDATAGLGRDALVMAAAGCRVTMIEHCPLLAAMLAHSLATPAPQLRQVAARMRLLCGDALHLLSTPGDVDVIYLDPMYDTPGRRAKPGKEMQLLQGLLGADPDPAPLLAAALACDTCRVVVKRHRKAPAMADMAPHHSITGRSTRFDVYLPSR